jgi:hypothetical protein
MARSIIKCPDCGYRFSFRTGSDDDREAECPDCGTRFQAEPPRANSHAFRDSRDDEDRNGSRRRRDRDDGDEGRARKKSQGSGDDTTKKVVGGVFSVIVVLGIIALKVYLRIERDRERDKDNAVAARQPVNFNPPPQGFNPPNQFNNNQPDGNGLAPNRPKPPRQGQPNIGRPDNPVLQEQKQDPPEKEHPEVKAILGRWDCRLGDGRTISYTFFEGSGRFSLGRADNRGFRSWSGAFSFVKSDGMGTNLTIRRDGTYKIKPPLFIDEHEDGEVEIEVVDAKTIRIKSQKLPRGQLGWREFKRFE